MKCHRVFNILTAVIFCIALVITGCGTGSQGSGPGRVSGSSAESDTAQRMAYKEMRYLPEFADTSEKYGAYTTKSVGFIDDTFYLIRGNRSGYGYYITDCQLTAYISDGGEERVILDMSDRADADGRMLTAVPLKDGSVIVLLKTGMEVSDSGYCLYKVDSEGNEIYSNEYPDMAIPEGDRDVRLVADGEGRCCLLAGGEIFLFDEQGKASGRIDLSGKTVTDIVCSNSGTIYVYEMYTNRLTPVSFQTAGLGAESYSVPVSTLSAIATGDTADFLICDDITVYQYNCEDKELTPLFDLQDSQIYDASCIEVIGELKDGRIFLFSRDEKQETTEAALLTPKPLAECPVKEVVTIGTVYPSTDLLNNVVSFNRNNQDFNVSIINYRVGGRSYDEALEALKLDISIGKGPDLCDLDDFHDRESLFAGGCFADLSGYLDESREYAEEDFIRQALDTCIWQEQLMAIPKYFKLQTIAGSPEVVGVTAGWDIDGLKTAVNSHPDAMMVFETRPSSYMFDVCIRNMLEEFIDKGKAHFDSSGYIDFLNFIKELPDNFNESECWIYGNEWLREGRALLSVREIRRFTDLQELEAAFGGEYTCIGYPSPQKEPDHVITGLDAYAVSANSQNKDNAWKFLEWFHSTQGEEAYDSVLRGGFPTRIDVFERELQEASTETGAQENRGAACFADGTSMNYRDMTPEEKELIYSLIENASPERSAEHTVLEIMTEEAAYLYDGSKTAEEVAGVTQNRVQLYLDE